MRTRVTLFALLLAGSIEALAAPQLHQVWVDKTRRHYQTSATAVALSTNTSNCLFRFDCAYAFSARVAGTDISAIPAPTISGPINSGLLGSRWNGGALGYDPSGSWWMLGMPLGGEINFATQSDVDAAFGSGLYTFTVQGQTYAVNLAGDAYPQTPVMTVAGTGAWSGGKFVFDPRTPVTIMFSPSDLGPLGGYVALNGCFRGTCPFVTSGSTVSLSIPANTLVDGEELTLNVTQVRYVDEAAPVDGPHRFASYNSGTQALLRAQLPQVFPMTVNSNITPTVSNATAQIAPRPEDVGTTASIFSFFVAPSTKVLNAAMEKGARLAVRAEGTDKAASVECVLAQLNSSGQLVAVSASALQAYITGVLSGQGQAVNMLNNIATANIAGTSLYVGYGQSALDMLTKGLNQRALSIPGEVFCDPKAPKTGWWWNPAEGGRGYSIEVAGRNIFFASYLYALDGRATWYVASGRHSLDGSLFVGSLEGYSRGQSLGGTYRAPGPAVSAGTLTLAFADASHGTMIWPGGTTAIERFNIVPNGTTMSPMASEPESGWWWNPEESGRGYFLEWQGGQLFMAGYMYDDNGEPLWYLSSNTTSNAQSYAANWWQFANGQTLGGAYRAATRINDNVAPVTITFSGASNAIMTLPNGRTTNIRRFRF